MIAKVKDMLRELSESGQPSLKSLESLLAITRPQELAAVYGFADQVRRQFMGDGILLRGIIEFSNHCRNRCFYCGLNRDNQNAARYRLSTEEIISGVERMYRGGIRTVVLQSGEDDALDPRWLTDLLALIKERFEMAVTLSVGERTAQEYAMWKEAGADRYLLKIETSNRALYDSLHTKMSFSRRLACLDELRRLGYQVGCGNMVGLKGQTLKILAEDILFFKEKAFDMIGIGPFIPHPMTRLGQEAPGDLELTLKTIALTRIVTKNSHLPATTALGSLQEDFRPRGLRAGANVLMPNFTPLKYRKLYEIYPGKRCIAEPAGSSASCLEKLAASVGRSIDYSRGDSLKTAPCNA